MNLKDLNVDSTDAFVCIDVGITDFFQEQQHGEIPKLEFIRSGGDFLEKKSPTEEEVKERIKTYSHEIKDWYLYLRCTCDGTLFFAFEMFQLLSLAGCKDIEVYEKIEDKNGPLRSVFTARGKTPDGFEL